MQRRRFLESMGGASFALLFANACGDSATDSAKDSGTEGNGTGGGNTGGNTTGGNATNGGSTGSSSTGGAGSDANGVTGGTNSGQHDAGMLHDAGEPDAGPMAPACAATIVAQITCRHGHKLEITAQDLTDGVEKEYDIKGTNATHGHKVTVTAAHFATLKRGETVMIPVPSRGQPHNVYLSCAAGWKPAERDAQECN